VEAVRNAWLSFLFLPIKKLLFFAFCFTIEVRTVGGGLGYEKEFILDKGDGDYCCRYGVFRGFAGINEGIPEGNSQDLFVIVF
jgi:hypothetical protein